LIMLGLVDLNALNMLMLIGVVGVAIIGIVYVASKVFKREEILIRWK
jgi:hypothetical protein